MTELLNCSSRAAITVNHRLGSSHNFLTVLVVLEAGSVDQGVGWVGSF